MPISAPESFQSRAFRFSVEILRFSRRLEQVADLPRHLVHQMVRAGTAIGANLEEARSAPSKRDRAAKYTISLRESRECAYWLRLIAAEQPQLDERVRSLLDDCGQLTAVLTVTVKKLRASAG